MSSSDRLPAKPFMIALSRLPDLNSLSCLTRYSGCCWARLGLTGGVELPSAAWQATHTWPNKAAPLARSGLADWAWALNDKAAAAAAQRSETGNFMTGRTSGRRVRVEEIRNVSGLSQSILQ